MTRTRHASRRGSHGAPGPALSLPSMLFLGSLMGTKKTVIYVTLVVVMATVTGLIFGVLFG